MSEIDLEAWHRFLLERGLDPTLAALWSKQARPAIRLVPSAARDDDTEMGVSKLGGMPDMPAGANWPTRSAYQYPRERYEYLPESTWEQGSLAFLAQINLRDVAEVGCGLPLPKAGLLLFFYDAETQPWGSNLLDAPGSKVLFVSAETPTERRQDPAGKSSRARSVTLARHDRLPGWEWVEDKARNQLNYSWKAFRSEMEKLSDQDWERISTSGPVFGGWPNQIQGLMELECEMVTNGVRIRDTRSYSDPILMDLKKRAAKWRLLMQLDSDDDLSWMWGDVGSVYFWCREDDIAQKRFDRAWTILQCT